MIRRKSEMDNKYLHSLIRTELYPFTQKTFPHVKYNEAEMDNRLKRGNTYVYSKTKNSPPEGFINILIKGKVHYVDLLAVKKSARKKGIGSKLMDWSLSMAKKSQCVKSHLYVDLTNSNAQQFYSKRGYYIEKFEPSINCYLMSKKVV